MSKRIPTVCFICSLLIIGICFIAREASAQTSRYGCYQVTAAALASENKALAHPETNGYITTSTSSTGLRKRKVCSLTDKGMQAYRMAATAWSQALPQIETAVHAAGVTQCCTTEPESQFVEFALQEKS